MALWMEAGSEPATEKEVADLEAIYALKESAATELKEKGNEYVKKGKKHYSDAIDCYTRAINQKALGDSEQSVLFSNRAHVNLLLGNYRRSLQDAEEAIKLCSTNVKAFYRAVKASFSLNLLAEAERYCEKGLELCPENEDLRRLAKQIDLRKSECELREALTSKALADVEALVSAFQDRGLKLGKAMYQELTGVKKPKLDENNFLHWPVLLLYAEVMSSDFIEDFCETDMFSTHLDMLFSEGSQPLEWDTKNAYTRDAIELFYEAVLSPCLSKKELYKYLLEGTAASHLEDFGEEEINAAKSRTANGSSKWVKVNEKRTLYSVLCDSNFIITGIPVFFVVSKNTDFYKEFKSGNWMTPS